MATILGGMSEPYRTPEEPPSASLPPAPVLTQDEPDIEADEVVGVSDVSGQSGGGIQLRRMDVLVALVIVATTVAFVLWPRR